MKRNWFYKTLGVALALSLAVGGLTACGDRESGEGGGGGRGSSNANNALAKEHVYSFKEFDLPDLGGDDMNIYESYRHDGRIYLLLQVYHWSENAQDDYWLVSVNEDGSGVESVQLEQPRMGDGDKERPEEDADAGDLEDLTEGLPAVGTVDIADEEIYMPDEPYESEYAYMGNFVFGGDRLYSTYNYNYYYEDYANPENTYSLSKNYVCSWTLDGALLYQSELQGMRVEEEDNYEYIYVNTMIAQSDGSVELLMSGNSGYRQVVEADGTVGERLTLDDEISDVLYSSNYLLFKDDGTLLAIYYDQNDWMTMWMVTYDPVSRTLGEPVKLPQSISYGGFSAMSTSSYCDLIYTASTGVYTYNMGDENGVEKMNFINSDLNITSLRNVVELDENTMLGVFYESYSGEYKAGIFTYVPPEEVPDKEVLILAGSYVGYDVRQRVVEFNRNSDEYRIVVKNYDTYNTYDDYTASYTMLNNDIITGNMPDILFTSNLPIENYIAKGLLADVGKMIEDDEELSQVEFVQNVFDAFSVDGTLYHVIPYFAVRTMMAKEALVGDRTSWTMEEVLKLLASMPEGTYFTDGLTREYFFNMVMQYGGSDFVDVDTGKCDFNTENFIAMMEFGKALPEEIVYEDDYWMNYESQFRDERTILCETYISRIANLNYIMNGYFGEDVSFIGFPTDNGQGGVVYANEAYCISSKSAHPDVAWEFLRYYLTDEYQKSLDYGLPIKKDVFEEKAKEAMQRPYWLDENGEKVEYDDYFYMNGEEIILEPMTQAQVDEVVNYIYTVDKVYYYNTAVMDIINEEMDAFYTGQKSAEEVAGIIQNRVQLYVDENR